MKCLSYLLVAAFLLVQYQLWFGAGGIKQVFVMRNNLAKQSKQNDQIKKRNDQMQADTTDLKKGGQAIEERARNELGMIKKGETFYQVVGRHESK